MAFVRGECLSKNEKIVEEGYWVKIRTYQRISSQLIGRLR